MTRVLLSSAVVVSLIVAPATPAPRLKDKEPRYFYPTRVGEKRVFMIGDQERTIEVTEVKEEEKSLVVITSGLDGQRIRTTETYRVSDKGLFRLAIGNQTFLEPLCMLKLPFEKDEQWKFDNRPKFPDWGTFTSVGRERVEVPAGRFDTVRIELDRNPPQRATYWYAEGIGLVKAVYADGLSCVLKS